MRRAGQAEESEYWYALIGLLDLHTTKDTHSSPHRLHKVVDGAPSSSGTSLLDPTHFGADGRGNIATSSSVLDNTEQVFELTGLAELESIFNPATSTQVDGKYQLAHLCHTSPE